MHRLTVPSHSKLSRLGCLVAVLLAVAPGTLTRAQSPPMPEVYELAADTWLQSVTLPGRDLVGLVIEGARLFPGRLKLVYEAAALCAQAGVLDVVHRFADYGIDVAPDAKTKAHFQELKAGLPPLPPAPAAPPPAAPPKS